MFRMSKEANTDAMLDLLALLKSVFSMFIYSGKNMKFPEFLWTLYITVKNHFCISLRIAPIYDRVSHRYQNQLYQLEKLEGINKRVAKGNSVFAAYDQTGKGQFIFRITLFQIARKFHLFGLRVEIEVDSGPENWINI